MAGVNCGGHIAENCKACESGNGRLWCNGECFWAPYAWGGGECMLRTGLGDPLQDPGRQRWFETDYGVEFAITALLMLIFACVYHRKVVSRLPLMEDIVVKSGREKGLFECLGSPSTCAYVACCAPLVAGKNLHATGVLRFWPGCCLTFIGLHTPCVAVFPCVWAVLSARMARTMGQQASCAWQFLLSLFCFPCELGRESMEVDDELGAEIYCCNQLELTSRLTTEVDNMLAKAQDSRMCGRMCTS